MYAIILQFIRSLAQRTIELMAFSWLRKHWSQIKVCLQRLKKSLDDLDARTDSRVKAIKQKLARLDLMVDAGASKGIVKKRIGNLFFDKLNSWWYAMWQKLDWLDTQVFFAANRIRQRLAGYGAGKKKL